MTTRSWHLPLLNFPSLGFTRLEFTLLQNKAIHHRIDDVLSLLIRMSR